MSKKIYSDIDLNKNEIQNVVVQTVSSFPANAKEGQMVYHTTFKSNYSCINDTMNTTLKGAWSTVDASGLRHDTDIDKILITDVNNAFKYDDVNGGTFT